MLHAHCLLSTTGAIENTPDGCEDLYPILTILYKIYTVFDVITELFAYVIMGQKNRRNYRTPPLDIKWRTSVTQLKIIENTKTHDCWQTRYEIAFPAYYLINH